MSSIAVLWTIALLGATPLMPYRAVVAEQDAIVRGGPGEAYYVTQYLPEGTAVEVHRRTDSGWLAIRPPRGSFSWIPAPHVRMSEESEVAVVEAAQAVSYIGTLLGTPQQYQWQVQLEPGELVQILHRVERPVGETTQTWLKIAPPSNEFRWIHESQVGPADEIASEPEVTLGPARPPSLDNAPTQKLAQLATFTPSRDEPEDSREEEFDSKQDGKWTATRSDRPSTQKAAADKPLPIAAPVAASKPREPGKLVTTFTPSTDAVHDLDVALTLLASQDPSDWKLEPLRDRATQLIDNGASALERGQARLLLERIGEFEVLHKRYQELAGGTGGTSASDVDSLTAQYDGAGILMPVHSTRRSAAPPFALLDPAGNVVAFVAPAPGLNLNRYLKKEVGLIGDRRHLDGLKSDLITAERVVELERHRR